MDFVLNTYHKDVRDEELLNDILRVSKMYDKDRLSQQEYNKYGQYHSSTISKRFGGWNVAVMKIGLKPCHTGKQKHDVCECDEVFFADMRKIAEILDKKSITTGDYIEHGHYNYSSIIRKYGSWNTILKLAGLEPTPYRLGKGKEISDEELFQDIERVWIKLGRQPTITDIKNGEFSFGQNTFVRRFGGWRGTLEAFVKYINSENETTPVNDEIENKSYIETSPPTKESQAITPHKSSRKTTRDINLRLRFKVMQRDNFKCCICGKSPATSPNVTLHIDHIKPWSKGGETTIDNLQTLCSDCNLGKSDLCDE